MYNSEGPFESSFKCMRDGLVRASPYVTEQVKNFIKQKLSEVPPNAGKWYSSTAKVLRRISRKVDTSIRRILFHLQP